MVTDEPGALSRPRPYLRPLELGARTLPLCREETSRQETSPKIELATTLPVKGLDGLPGRSWMQKWNSTTSNPFYINLVYTAFSNLIYVCVLIVLDCVYVPSGGQFCLFLNEWKSSYIRASCSKTCLSTISEHTDKASVYGGGSNLLLMCVWLSVQLP